MKSLDKIRIAALAAGLLLGSLLEAAQTPQVSASCSRNQIRMDESVRYTVHIENASKADVPDLSGLSGWQVIMGPSTSRQTSVINGVASSSLEYGYELRPLKTGTLTIDGGKIRADGKTYSLRPLQVDVLEARAATRQEPEALESGGEIFLELDASKTNVFIGEQFLLTITLYYRNVNLANLEQFELKLDGFNSQDIGNYQQDQQRYGGQIYQYVRLQKLMVPLRPGRLTVGPATARVTINVPQARSRRSQDIFDDPFFGFQRYSQVQKGLSSEPLSITVAGVPQDGRPKDFQGAIGTYALDAEISQGEVKEGESVTLKATLRGVGNIEQATLSLCQTNTPAFKTYDPEVKKEIGIRNGRQQGAKYYSQMWIPTAPGQQEIPAVTFSYFDTQKNEYVTLVKGPFPVDVQKSEQSQKLVVSEAIPAVQGKGPAIKILNQDIFGLKMQSGETPAGRLRNQSLLLALLALPPVIYLLALLLAWRLSKGEDKSYKRRSNAAGKAQKALRQAARLKSDRQATPEFCALLTQAVAGYVADYKDVPQSSVNKAYLSECGLPPETIAAWEETMPQIEMARFSGLSGDPAANEKLLDKTARLLKDLRSNLK